MQTRHISYRAKLYANYYIGGGFCSDCDDDIHCTNTLIHENVGKFLFQRVCRPSEAATCYLRAESDVFLRPRRLSPHSETQEKEEQHIRGLAHLSHSLNGSVQRGPSFDTGILSAYMGTVGGLRGGV